MSRIVMNGKLAAPKKDVAKRSAFDCLAHEDEIYEQGRRQAADFEERRIREEKARASMMNAEDLNGNWADMSDDESTKGTPVEPETAPVEESSESEAESEAEDTVARTEAPKAQKPSQSPPLKKSELKKKDMDDLDALLGELGIETAKDASRTKGKKKKKAKKDEKEGESPEASESPAVEKEEEETFCVVDPAVALAKKGKAKAKAKGKSAAEKAKEAALQEAKNRKKADKKKDKSAFDR